MWSTFAEADFGFKSEGYVRLSLYRWTKTVSGRPVVVEIQWHGDRLFPKPSDG